MVGAAAGIESVSSGQLKAIDDPHPPPTHRGGPFILNVLRVCDVPNALGLLAPRALTLKADGATVLRVEAVYKAAGARRA